MAATPNSMSARDVASLVHPQANLRTRSASGVQVFSRGDGVRVFDESGKDYLECFAGLWCASLGFRNERLAQAAYDQMTRLGYYHIYRNTSNEPAIELAEKLLTIAPVPMSKVMFHCSGSEANDAAIKMCWYYHNATGNPGKRKIIGRMNGYHGSTSATTSLSGLPDKHRDFNLPFEPFLHTEFPHYYRLHEEGETESEFATRLAEALEALILEEGPDTVAAFFAEPVMGAAGGILPPETYFERVQSVLAKYDVLFVVDEVICGFGRTGNWWGSQTFDLHPDMITSAKALSAGMQPISAVLINDRVYQGMLSQSDKLGSFAHGATFGGHPVAAAVALEAIRIYEEDDLVNHARDVGATMLEALSPLREHPMIADLRGVGLLASMELVDDKAARTNFPADRKLHSILEGHCRDQGVIPRLGNDRVAFTPPLVITHADVVEAVARFRRALDATWAEVRTG